MLLPTENNKLTLAWRGPYKVVEVMGEVDYRIAMGNLPHQYAETIFQPGVILWPAR